ncbi:MAG TPA: AI-2E family transporter [Polyangiaceae bacterium]|nr:AI-2E family transporter [Polyangiaceae bacterium]
MAGEDDPSRPSGSGPESIGRKVAARESRALEWCAGGAVVVILWIATPVTPGLLLGTLMAFSIQPVHEAIQRRLARPALAALLTVTLTALLIIGSVGGFGSLFVARGVVLTGSLLAALGPNGTLADELHSVTGLLARVGLSVDVLTHKLRDAAAQIASLSASFAESAAAATASGLLSLFFALLSMHWILEHWDGLPDRLEVVSPLRREYTRALLAEFERVGRATLLGTVVTGFAQGLLATVGYFLTGAPEPVFFGVATALTSLVPGIGTTLVWAPIGIFQVVTGHAAAGFVELVWGAVAIVGVSDYWIRPKLVGGDERLPTLVTFVALFGGVEVFGLKGLVVGPIAMSIAVATLRLYAREAEARRPFMYTRE